MIPSDIPDLELWLDADAIAGVSDGDTLLTWEDQSGNGNDYTNVGSNSGIKYQTGVLNGLPVVEMPVGGFTGAASIADDLSLFYVGNYTDGGSQIRLAVQSTAVQWWMGPHGAVWKWHSGTQAQSSGVTCDTNWVAHGVILERSETDEEAPFHFGFQYVYDIDTNDLPTVAAQITANPIGAIRLGNAGSQAFPMGGNMAELVAYSRALTPTERVGLTDYFRDKWGGITPSSSEDLDVEVRIAREALVVAHNQDAANSAVRMAREGIVVAHHFPEANTKLQAAGVRLVVAISRPHGDDIFDDPPL